MNARWRSGLAGVLVGALIAVGVPAGAGETDVTFAVDSGGLSLSAPASANLGSATGSPLGVTVSGALGDSVVNDLRGSVSGNWTVTVAVSDFTTGAGTGNQRIAESSVSVYSGAATTTGVGVVLPTTALTPASDGDTLLSATAIVGSMTTTYNPTATVAVPASAAAGVYSGTITQTVL